MKKLNLESIATGLDMVKDLIVQNNSIARDEMIDVDLIDLAEKNTYAADDTDEDIRNLADQIEAVGLLNSLGVIEHHGRYTLFSGERRYKAITRHLHWKTIPCRVFEGISPGRAQLMLHVANGAREYSPARKLVLYEEYHQLLEELKASGEFRGGIQKGIAELLNVSDRQVRTYRVMSEALTPEEKAAVQTGSMSFGDAQAIATSRSAIADVSKPDKSGSTSAFVPETTTRPTLVQEEKTGSTSGFSKPAITPTLPEPDPQVRLQLLEAAILSETIWRRKELQHYYVSQMPTPQEAVKGILKPDCGYIGGTLDMENWGGSYDRTSSRLLLRPDHGNPIAYTYSEVDAAIRKLYRERKLIE